MRCWGERAGAWLELMRFSAKKRILRRAIGSTIRPIDQLAAPLELRLEPIGQLPYTRAWEQYRWQRIRD
jgi:hypothetical protein